MELFSERVLLAALIANLAMIALPVGAALGIYAKPSQKLVAVVMAFGSGALIEALAIELGFEGVNRLIHEHHVDWLAAWLYVAGGFVVGGLIFYGATRWLDARGAALRKPTTAKNFVMEKQREKHEELLGRLASVDLLRALPPEEMEQLLPCVRPVRVAAGNVIFRAGQPGDALYLIEGGRVDILTSGVDPTASRLADEGYQPIARLGPHDSFGEIALLSGAPRTAHAVAAEDSSLLRIGKDDFDGLIIRSPALREAVHTLDIERVMRSARTAPAGEIDRWRELATRSVQRVSSAAQEARARELLGEHAKEGGGAPVAIFMGALLDGIPECIVIGAGFTTLAALNPSFVVAVFLNNLPEAMSSAAGMVRGGFSPRRIFSMWFGLMVAGTIAAMLGSAFLADAPATLTTFVNALAGGGILAMLAATMMPEAFEEGGPTVGLATIAGFLAALFFAATALG
jgi:CRP-like cAMP-binding protein